MKKFFVLLFALTVLAVAGCAGKDGEDDKDAGEDPPLVLEQTFLAVGGVYHLAGDVTSDVWMSEGGTCEVTSFTAEATAVFLQGEDENGLLLNRVTYVENNLIVEGVIDEVGNFTSVFDNDPYSETVYGGMFWSGDDEVAWRYHGVSTTSVPAQQSCTGTAGVITVSLEGERDYYHSP